MAPLKIDDRHADLLYREGQALLALGKDNKAEEVTGAVESTIDGSRYARELYHLSRMLDLLGQAEQGLKRVEEDLELSRGDVDGLCLAGKYHRKQERLQTAAKMYQQALTPRPVTASAEEGLGAVSLDQRSPAAAVSHLEAAGASPDSPSWLNLLGVAHGRLGHADQAASRLRRAVEKRPDDVAIRANLALAEEHLGRHGGDSSVRGGP